MTLSAQLDQIQNAISAIETGAQEYRIADRIVKRGDLNTLYKERREIQGQIAIYGGSYDPSSLSNDAIFLRSKVID